jgi:hypothetical protein
MTQRITAERIPVTAYRRPGAEVAHELVDRPADRQREPCEKPEELWRMRRPVLPIIGRLARKVILETDPYNRAATSCKKKAGKKNPEFSFGVGKADFTKGWKVR